MRIRVTVSLEMTPEQMMRYASEYDLGAAYAHSIRQEIKDHVMEILEVSQAHSKGFFEIKDVK